MSDELERRLQKLETQAENNFQIHLVALELIRDIVGMNKDFATAINTLDENIRTLDENQSKRFDDINDELKCIKNRLGAIEDGVNDIQKRLEGVEYKTQDMGRDSDV